jgi:hypothetical protein
VSRRCPGLISDCIRSCKSCLATDLPPNAGSLSTTAPLLCMAAPPRASGQSRPTAIPSTATFCGLPLHVSTQGPHKLPRRPRTAPYFHGRPEDKDLAVGRGAPIVRDSFALDPNAPGRWGVLQGGSRVLRRFEPGCTDNPHPAHLAKQCFAVQARSCFHILVKPHPWLDATLPSQLSTLMLMNSLPCPSRPSPKPT